MTEKTRRDSAESTSLRDFRRGADENNLAEFPLALLTDTVPEGQKTIEFQDTLKDWKTGQMITRRVCVTGSDKFGLPTAKDEDVLLALVQLTKIANNFTNAEVWFTKHQVIELLGWKNRGWAYDRVEESLHRWKGVSVHYWNAWRDNKNGAWTDTEAIGIIDYFRLTDGRRSRKDEGRDSQSRFIWNRVLFESFQAGYLKPLDFGIFRSLERPAARRAYRFLDKRFWHQPEWEFDLQVFACEKLGLSRAYDTGQLKERLRPALGELENMGFIEPVRYRKEKPKKWKIAIAKKQSDKPMDESSRVRMDADSLLTELIRREINVETAKELVEKYATESIREKIDFFDWLVGRSDKRVSKNGPGWLATAIRKDFPLPNDYRRAIGRAKPSGSAIKTTPVKANTAEHAAPQPKTKDPVQQAIDEYLASLGEEELSKLEAAALERADSVLTEGYYRSKAAGGQTHAIYRRMLLEREAKRILNVEPQVLKKAS